jgi:hypothetical protein
MNEQDVRDQLLSVTKGGVRANAFILDGKIYRLQSDGTYVSELIEVDEDET